MRNLVFVSHANPEDNEFARWLTLQLARRGYNVWCDLTKMLGGEDPWLTPEQAIREHTCKFLYVLSRVSNGKRGVAKEVQVAENVSISADLDRFIIPLLVDDLPSREMNIRVTNSLPIPFNESWAAGLNQLLECLERDDVPCESAHATEQVAQWWRSKYSASGGLSDAPEQCASNWFAINDLPETLYVHRLGLIMPPGRIEVDEAVLPFPGKQQGQNLITFAPAEDFAGQLGASLRITESQDFRTLHLLEDEVNPIFKDRATARRLFSELLRKAWDHMVKERRLPTYTYTDGGNCFYFTSGLTEKDQLRFVEDGRQAYRNSVGYRNIKKLDGTIQKRYWHVGFQARPMTYPMMGYSIKTHVLFSDDGSQLWESKDKMHRARRRQCANWWNKKWRGLLLGGMTWLADGSSEIRLPVATGFSISVSFSPLLFESPMSYIRSTEIAGDEDESQEDGMENETEEVDSEDEDY